MKNRITTALLLSSILALAGCGSGEAAQPQETAGSETQEETKPEETASPEDKDDTEETSADLYVGKISGNTYKNGKMGLKAEFPEDWKIIEGAEFLQYTGQDPDARIEDLETGQTWFDLFAVNIDEGKTLNITLALLPSEAPEDSEEVMATALTLSVPDTLIDALQSQGLEDVTAENDEITFLGKNKACVRLHGSLEGMGINETQVYILKGKTMMCITSVSYNSDTADEMLEQFEKYGD